LLNFLFLTGFYRDGLGWGVEVCVMTDAEYEEQKGRIRKLVEEWVKPIGLGWWRIDFEYEREDKPCPEGATDSCVAECHVAWKYLQATITFYLPQVARLDDERLEYAFVHELMHVYLNQMRPWMSKEWPQYEFLEAENSAREERVATELGHAFVWLKQQV
jgi:hypothetical protein